MLVLTSCSSPSEKLYLRAQDLQREGEFGQAVDVYEKIIARAPNSSLALRSAREGARVSLIQLKNFEKASRFYQLLVLDSPDAEERLAAQKQIATIYTENSVNPAKATKELSKLLSMLKTSDERIRYQQLLARAYFHQNNFTQSLLEIEALQRENLSASDRFSVLVLRGNVELAQKNLAQAAATFQSALSLDPERAVKENVAITLAVAFEEMKDFDSAIRILTDMKKYHPQPEYIEIRIRRLLERKKAQPGARGMRK